MRPTRTPDPAPASPVHLQVLISPRHGGPSGLLADAVLQFTYGPLAGLDLQGFAIWARRTGTGLNVTFPARSYDVHGERRSFALLRPAADRPPVGQPAQDRIRDLILDAHSRHEENSSSPDAGPTTWRYDVLGYSLDDAASSPIGAPGTYTRDFPITLTPEQQAEQARIDAQAAALDSPAPTLTISPAAQQQIDRIAADLQRQQDATRTSQPAAQPARRASRF